MRSIALCIGCLIGSLPVAGQINCSFSSIKVTQLHSKKCLKFVELRLECTGGTPTPMMEYVPGVDITVISNVPIDTLPEPRVIIDPGSNNLQGATSGGGWYDGLVQGVGGDGVPYGSTGYPNVFDGQSAGNVVHFRGIPFDPSPNGRTVIITLYVDLCQVHGNSSDPFTVLVSGKFVPTASLPAPAPSLTHATSTQLDPAESSAGPTYTVTPSQLNLGTVVDCWVNQVSAGSAPANQAFNVSLLGSSPTVPSTASATLRYNAAFPACVDVRATGYQDDPTQFYENDLGFTAPGFPSPLANFGSLFQAGFNNIPAGVSLFVQTSVTSPLGTVMLTSPGTAVGSTGLTQIPVANGSATAIWEAQTASTTVTGVFAIPVYFAYQSGVASPSNITVVQSLASAPGGVQYLQPPANLIQPVAFSINTGTGAAPTLSASLDSRPCIVGVTFWTNNACTPGNGLLVNVVSDTAPVPENSPTFTSTGGLTNTALLNTITPSLIQIFPKASQATPGVYKETMTIMGAGADSSASVSVPFTVTVLPPNNPVFELTGVADAFSYQTETIAPGQIYTIFGSNFGPANLTSGTLDSSGKLGNNVANTQVFFDGIASPLLYAVNGQLSGVAPFELTGKTSTNVQIVSNGLTSPMVAVPVVQTSISIASADGSGGNGAVVLNKDGTLNTVSNPASVGDEVVIYASYAGPFANGVTGTDARTTTGAPYPAPAGTPGVMIGGVAATNIPYFANAPGFLESVMQINVIVPSGVQSSPYNQLVISAGGTTSTRWTTIAVQ